MSVFPWHCCKEMSFWHNAARPSIRPLKAIKYFYILTQKEIFNKNPSRRTSSSDAFIWPVCLKLIERRGEFKSLLCHKPFDRVCSIPAGETVAGGQLAHTQLIRQAAVVGAVQTEAVQKVPEKQDQTRDCDSLCSSPT